MKKDLETRANAHAALGDTRRLLIVDQLARGSDLTVAELADLVGMRGNLLAHHLDVLEAANLVRRRTSEGDRRRKYVSLNWRAIPSGLHTPRHQVRDIAFVCTHNSARSQFAAALWEQATGRGAASAGSQPAGEVHPKAIRIASEFGLDISSATPGGYERITSTPDMVISVCDRARESGVPPGREEAHWSIRDPVPVGTLEAFRSAFSKIAERMEHLVEGVESQWAEA